MRVISLAWLSVAAFGLAAGPSLADDWTVTVGGRLQGVVPYEGAGQDIFLPVPSLSLRRAGRPDRLSPPDDNPAVSLISLGRFSAGPTVRLRGHRDDLGPRVGLTPVDLAGEAGLFAAVWPTDWLRARVEGRRGVFGHNGWLGDASVDLVARLGHWTASVGPRAGWGDARYMQTYFGVTPAEAAASPVINAAYQPGGGLRYLGLQTTLGYRWNSHWQALANVGYHRLSDRAADSPIVQALASRDEISGGVGLRYSFTVHR